MKAFQTYTPATLVSNKHHKCVKFENFHVKYFFKTVSHSFQNYFDGIRDFLNFPHAWKLICPRINYYSRASIRTVLCNFKLKIYTFGGAPFLESDHWKVAYRISWKLRIFSKDHQNTSLLRRVDPHIKTFFLTTTRKS